MTDVASKFDPRSGKPRKSLAQVLAKYRVLPSGCWQWTGTRNKYGYGVVCLMIDGKVSTMLAHRLQWMHLRGPVPDGLEVCHNCPGGDNRDCMNPDHLWVGTHGENIKDATEKWRALAVDRANISGLLNQGGK